MKPVLFDQKNLTYLITKGNLTSENFTKESKKTIQIIKSAVEAKISLIQIREKELTTKLIATLATEVVKIAKNSDANILINDRLDIALATKADGVHLTSKSIPTEFVRKNVSQNFLIGVSTHSFEKAEEAKKQGADFVTYSPIFQVISKPKYNKPKGLDNLEEICSKLRSFPVLALGGINKENYQKVLEKGASGFASISFLNDVENLKVLSK